MSEAGHDAMQTKAVPNSFLFREFPARTRHQQDVRTKFHSWFTQGAPGTTTSRYQKVLHQMTFAAYSKGHSLLAGS
jgi:hypothetical protein